MVGSSHGVSAYIRVIQRCPGSHRTVVLTSDKQREKHDASSPHIHRFSLVSSRRVQLRYQSRLASQYRDYLAETTDLWCNVRQTATPTGQQTLLPLVLINRAQPEI